MSRYMFQFSSVTHVHCFVTPWTAACQASLSINNSWSVLKFISIESVMPSNHLILCRPLLLPSSIFPSTSGSFPRSQFFESGGQSTGVSASASEYSGLISFRLDWLNLLAVQGPFKSLLQHHSSKASILRHSAFFIVQHSHPCMTPGKTIALTMDLCCKVMSLFFNMLSRLVITFHPRSKHLLISWLQSPSAVILEPKKIVYHCFCYFPIVLP